jgi:F0F1-type ATP synthase alpha subunit
MFESAKLFNQPLNSWDVSSVTSFEEMFSNAEDFDQDIGSWIINNIASTSFYGMFISAATFNNGGSPSISGWSVSAITSLNMRYMFSASTQFNQDLSNWCVVNISTKPIGFDTGTNNWAGGTSTRPQWGNPC